MKHSIYLRNLVAIMLIVLAAFIVLGGLSLTWSYRRALTEKRVNMTATVREASRYISAQSHHEDFDLQDLNISMWLSMVSGVSGFELLITDADGVVVSCSERRFAHMGAIIPQRMLNYAQGGTTGVTISSLG